MSVADLEHRRLLFKVDLHSKTISDCKRIALRRIDQIRRRTGYRPQFIFGVTHGRHGGQKTPRVGMSRMVEHIVSCADLDDLAGIHDGYTVSDVCYNAQVMGDEYDANIQLFLKTLDKV